MISRRTVILFLLAFCFHKTPGLFAAKTKAKDRTETPSYTCSNPSFSAHAEMIMRILEKKGLDREQSGMVIVSADSPDPLFAYHADLPLLPASVMKAFTTAAALHYLKPEYVFSTVLSADALPEQGVIRGNLYLKASGDPFFTPEQMHAFAARMAFEGIHALRGTLIVDTTVQEAELYPSAWDVEDIGETYAPPLSPLSYAFNAFALRMVGGNSPDRKPDIEIMPDLPMFHVANNALVTAKGKTRLSVTVVDPAPDGGVAVMVDGTITAGDTFRNYLTIKRPAEYFLAAFFAALRQEGIETDLMVRFGAMPAEANVLITQESLPLGVLIRNMNLVSNNFMAELILRQTGGQVFGFPGSTEKGVRALQQFLEEIGIPPAAHEQWDGSGLSKRNRSTAMVIARLFLAMRARYDIGPDFMAALSTNGGEGTLAAQIKEPEYYRRFRAKNGALRGVYAAGGYLTTLSGKQLVVVFMLNNAALSFANLQEVGNDIIKTVVLY